MQKCLYKKIKILYKCDFAIKQDSLFSQDHATYTCFTWTTGTVEGGGEGSSCAATPGSRVQGKLGGTTNISNKKILCTKLT
jgi:hypothetical protein